MTINLNFSFFFKNMNFGSTHLLNWEFNSMYGSLKNSNFDFGFSFEN
jgi:hypothetical protein